MYQHPPPGLHRHPTFEPQCTHATMTRIYSPTLLCSSCRYPGPSGWLYQCTQDREDLIEHAVRQGEFVNMDHVGCQLTPMMGIRKGTPAAREDRLSFFKEISQKQLARYHPDQIAKILRQRENVQLAIQRDKIQKSSAAILSRLAQPYGLDSASCSIGLQKPWLCSPQEECQYRVCQNCRPSYADRAFLSLNAVANGEVPPTAAAGYSFHLLGQRPVIDASILLNIGCRPVPLPRSSPASTEHDSPASTMSVMDLLDAQIARGRILWTRRTDDAEIEEYDADYDWSLMPMVSNITSGHLKYSPGCENLGALSENTTSNTFDPQQWTPPPSVNNLPGNENTEDDHSSTSSKRAQSAPSSETDTSQPAEGHVIGHLRELSLDESSNKPAAGSSHPTSKKFTPLPLKVPHGIAVLEESVELGVPDVITQA
ncbi:hypothetical protein M441DRAFT_249228 [Trichoderma asperellum CBS 433.97]|uniref:Uncharacterized protein n=1 Tax=Trichoderma asperellum (strain ATCC 204424 / CBS 433.97 / NBRC 101777) TaxID=1042311 RepID=A0A2T3Z0C4_TRIA4|nr:hypothetical protein M441DRAFT_249228 [Trichoderma asperellum CBS 433.97]PTB38258.1 hypothetical protein M441DRAFT_249228 [Trichoderma asperellum CBS 433.97]